MTAEQILARHSSNLDVVAGSRLASAVGVSTADNPMPATLVFVSSRSELDLALSRGAHIVVASKKSLKEGLSIKPEQCLLATSDITQAMSIILTLWDDKSERQTPGISPTAAIAPSAQIGPGVSIGPFAVIADGAVVGEGTTLGAHVVLEKGATIGSHCYLHPKVVIGARCQIGHRCEIHSGTVIGSDGFGYWTDKNRVHHKVPQIGIVVIEDDVEIGSNCAIDRATLSETRIGLGTKLDNLVHIAHNCRIGKNSRLTAGFMTAGSTHIGDNFLCGGVCQVADHIQITDDVTLAGRSTVTNDITAPGLYGGYPLEPLKDALKTLANMTHLTSMRKQLHQIRKHLGLLNEREKKS